MASVSFSCVSSSLSAASGESKPNGVSSSMSFCSTSKLKALCVPSWATPSYRAIRISCSASEHTLAKVQEIVSKQLAVEPSKVVPSSKLTDLGADSLDTVEIVMGLEEHFKINVEEEGAEKIATVQDAANLIQILVDAKEAEEAKKA